MSRTPHDPDLEFLQDRELLELATLLRSRRPPEPPLDPAFRSSLRRELRRKHYELLEPSTSWWRRLTSGPGLAWSGATAGAVAIAVALVFALHPPPLSGTTYVSSPLDHMRNVAVVQPMKLTFQTAMDHQSVESALQIQPATSVTYSWRGNTLYVQPVAGQLAPNTQYKLTLTTTAKTEAGQPIQQPATITFVTGATKPPAPTPSTSPSPAAPGLALVQPVQLAPAAPVTPAWSADGATLYFAGADGTLESIARGGGSPQPLGGAAVTGVRQIAVSPDGATLAVATDSSVTTLQRDGTQAVTFPAGGTLALSWRAGKLYAALPAGVFEVKKGLDQHAATAFAVPAQQAAFSPSGQQLLYLDTSARVHLLDLPSGQDTAWPVAVTTLPEWSQDGGRAAYLTADGLAIAGPDGTGATPLATLAQLGLAAPTGAEIAWSGGAVLTAGAAELGGVDTTLKQPAQLAAGNFTAITGSSRRADIAYVQDGALWTASLLHPGVQPQLESAAEQALKSFMDARVAGDADTAQKLLATPAAAEYRKATLLFTGKPALARWFGVFEQARPDGSVVEIVRLVLSDEHQVDVQQLDETLTMRQNADGTFSVVDVQQSATRPVDAGPEVVGIAVAGGQVTVTFDSDLKPDSVAGITLGGAQGTYAQRVLTFALSGAQPGDVLTLTIPTTVQDLSGRSAAQAQTVQIVVPSSSS